MNYSRDGAIQAGDTTVGLGSPRPVLHGEHILVVGGRGTETTVLLGECIRLDKIKAWYIII